MELNAAASWFLVIFYFVLAICSAVALVVMAMALGKLNAKLEETLTRIEPQLAKADEILAATRETISSVGNRAEGILAQGEETAESVHHKVDVTATAVQRTIHAPIIGLNSLAAGVSRGVETFGKLQRASNGNGSVPATLTAVPVAAAPVGQSQSSAAAEQNPAGPGKETSDGGQ